MLYLSAGSFSCRLCREWMLKTNWRQKNVEQRQQYMQQEKTFDFVNTGGCLTELSSVWNFRIFSPLSFISIAHSIQTWSKGSKVGYIQLQLLSDRSTKKKQMTWKDSINLNLVLVQMNKWMKVGGDISLSERQRSSGKGPVIIPVWA